MFSLRESHRRHAVYYASILREANDLCLKDREALLRGLALFDQEWRNIKAGQQWTTSQTEKDDAAAELCRNYADSGMYILLLREHPNERIRWLEPAVTAARRLKEPLFEGR